MTGQQSDETLTRGPAANSDETRTGGELAGRPVSADPTLTRGMVDGAPTHSADTGTGDLFDQADSETGDVANGTYEVMPVPGQGTNGVVHLL
jgi:hypothetical protein